MFSIISHWRYSVKWLLDSHVYDILPIENRHWIESKSCRLSANLREEIQWVCCRQTRLSDRKSTSLDWAHERRRDLVRDRSFDGFVWQLLLEDVSILWVVSDRETKCRRYVEEFHGFDRLPNMSMNSNFKQKFQFEKSNQSETNFCDS